MKALRHAGWTVQAWGPETWHCADAKEACSCPVTGTCSIAAPGTAGGAHLDLTVDFIAAACPRAWRCACCTSALHQLQRQQVLGHRRTKDSTAGQVGVHTAGSHASNGYMHAKQVWKRSDMSSAPSSNVVPPIFPRAHLYSNTPTRLPTHPASRHTHRMLSSREAPASVCRSERASPCRLHVMLTPAL